MHKWIVLGLMFIGSLTALGVEKQQAVSALQNQIKLLVEIQPDVEEADQPRLSILKRTSEDTLKVLASDQPFLFKNMMQYQFLVTVYRGSQTYKERIKSKMREAAINSVWETSEVVAQMIGYDDDKHQMFTEATFTQIEILLREMLRLKLSEELQQEVEGIIPAVGNAIAAGKTGDHAKTYEEVVATCYAVRKLYASFKDLPRDSALYKVSLEVEGALEYYITEYAHIGDKVDAYRP